MKPLIRTFLRLTKTPKKQLSARRSFQILRGWRRESCLRKRANYQSSPFKQSRAQRSSKIPQSSACKFPVPLALPEVVSVSRAAVAGGARWEAVLCSLCFAVGIYQILGVSTAAVTMSVPSALMKQPPIQSTAGAVPVRNEKGTGSPSLLSDLTFQPQYHSNLP